MNIQMLCFFFGSREFFFFLIFGFVTNYFRLAIDCSHVFCHLCQSFNFKWPWEFLAVKIQKFQINRRRNKTKVPFCEPSRTNWSNEIFTFLCIVARSQLVDLVCFFSIGSRNVLEKKNNPVFGMSIRPSKYVQIVSSDPDDPFDDGDDSTNTPSQTNQPNKVTVLDGVRMTASIVLIFSALVLLFAFSKPNSLNPFGSSLGAPASPWRLPVSSTALHRVFLPRPLGGKLRTPIAGRAIDTISLPVFQPSPPPPSNPNLSVFQVTHPSVSAPVRIPLPSPSSVAFPRMPLVSPIPPEQRQFDPSNMARVAILIGGLPRTFREAWPREKHKLLDANPEILFDIFIHTSLTKRENDSAKLMNDMINIYQDLERGVRVLSFMISEPFTENSTFPESAWYHAPNTVRCQGVNHFMSLRHQYGDMARIEAEKQLGITYDRVLHSRPDVYFNKPIYLRRDWWAPNTFFFLLGWNWRRYAFLNRDWDFGHFGDPRSMALWQQEWVYKQCVMGVDIHEEVSRAPDGYSKTCFTPTRCFPNLPVEFDGMPLWYRTSEYDPEIAMQSSMLYVGWVQNIEVDILNSMRSETWVVIQRCEGEDLKCEH
jgi:hypothetical protein